MFSKDNNLQFLETYLLSWAQDKQAWSASVAQEFGISFLLAPEAKKKQVSVRLCKSKQLRKYTKLQHNKNSILCTSFKKVATPVLRSSGCSS